MSRSLESDSIALEVEAETQQLANCLSYVDYVDPE